MSASAPAPTAPAAAAAPAFAVGVGGPVPGASGRQRGQPVSGRPWKRVQRTKFSAGGRTKSVGAAHTGQAFRAQQAAKARARAGRDELKRMEEARAAAAAEAKAKREEKQRRRAENELKGANFQVVSDLEAVRVAAYRLCQLCRDT